MYVKGKVALITGCASGIARHLTTVLAIQGGRILATDINPDALRKCAYECEWVTDRVMLKKLDVRSANDWREAIALVTEKWGRLDICMNIAGFAVQGFVMDFPLEHIDLHLDINTKGAILGTKFAAEVMVKQRSGHIVNMCSLAGLSPVPGTSLYSASKFALRGFSLAAYFELKPLGVSVTLVEPDLVDTEKLKTQLQYGDDAAAVGFSASRILTVEDIEKVFMKKVLKDKAVEVAIPVSRGWLCKFGGSFPTLSEKLFVKMARKGKKNIDRERAKRVNTAEIITPDRWILDQESKKVSPKE